MTNDRFKYRIYDVENKKYVDNHELLKGVK